MEGAAQERWKSFVAALGVSGDGEVSGSELTGGYRELAY